MITKKNRIFLKHYILNHNSAESARLAGYSDRTARSIGSKLLTKVDIKLALERLEKDLAEEYNITRDKVVKKYWKEVETAIKSSDRTNALNRISKVLGFIKDTTIQTTNIYNIKSPEEKKTLDEILRRTRPQHIVNKGQDKKS